MTIPLKMAFVISLFIGSATARFIQGENNQYRSTNSLSSDMFIGNTDITKDSEDPAIRIRIRTNGGTNVVPYILLKRQPNTSLRLRIQQESSSIQGPVRIIYRKNQPNISKTSNNLYSQVSSVQRPRVVFKASRKINTAKISTRMFMKARRTARL